MVAVHRFAIFTALIQEFHLTQQLTRGSRYEQFIAKKTLECLALTAEDAIFDHLPALLLHLYYNEMVYHPWGRLIWHHIRVVTPKGTRQVKDSTGRMTEVPCWSGPARVPNFLMPVDCLLCGTSLDFTTYKSSTLKKIRHLSEEMKREAKDTLNALVAQGHISLREILRGTN